MSDQETTAPVFEEATTEYTSPEVTEKKKRGRPKSSDTPAATTKKVKFSKAELADIQARSIESFKHMLQLATSVGSTLTKTPELYLSDTEAEALSKATVECLEAWFPNSHGAVMSPKVMTSITLIGTAGIVFSSKKSAIHKRKENEKVAAAKDITNTDKSVP